MSGELERARKAVRELNKTLKDLPSGSPPPPNEVHKLRTATRRVEAIAAALAQVESKESRRALKAIEPIRKAAGGVREMDVLLANARRLARTSAGDSLTRLVEHLKRARQQNAELLRRAIARRRDAARQNLKQYSWFIRSALDPRTSATSANGSPAPWHEGVHAVAMSVIRELGEWPPLNAENIHAFRLKVKGLRYILQLSGDANSGLEETLGDVQHRIGDWHDWHQLEEIAGQLLSMERDGALLTCIGAITSRKFHQALKAANSLRGKYLAMPLAQEA
jgi:CHAD domain-containing protein